MAEIRVLPQLVADKIAAGEVAERPSAVVKELVENSIDAGADRITVEIRDGGISYIRVEDNGRGIAADELEFAFVRHATSKIRDIDDLFSIETMGFRGEALASICAVADVEVLSKTADAEEGAHMTLSHGVPTEKSSVMCGDGTVMIVENLFANVPARMKFMKKNSTETGYVADVMSRIALSRPDISFCFIADGKEQFSTTGDGQLKNAILKIYGIEAARGIMEVDHEENGVKVRGAVGRPDQARGNRTRQTLFVNGRYIKNHVVSKVVEEAYRNTLMTGRFPFFVLNIELAPQLVDVNVHPAKTEIKFANEKEVYDIVYHAVKNTLYAEERRTEPTLDAKDGAASEASARRAETGSGLKSGAAEIPLRRADGSFNPKAYLPEKPDKQLIADILDSMKRESKPKMVFNEGDGAAHEDEGFAAPMTEGNGTKDVRTEENAAPEEELPFAVDEECGFIEEKAETVRIVGQVFDTYIIAESGGEMFMIDQHAAHERKRFELLKKDYEENRALGQVLLAPVVLEADRGEMQTIRDHAEEFAKLGFVIEEFGSGAAIIRETPFIGSDDEIRALVLELIPILADGRPSARMSFEERMLDMISCRYAIKANKRLSLPEMEALVRDTGEMESCGITTCPHGRPIKIRFTKREIEKMFKRIV